MNLKKNVSAHGKVMAVSMMKDEAPYLLEWFAHHMAVGFTDILVYTNDCSDGTDDMLIRLEELGLGYHRRNDIPEGIKPQPSALNYAQNEPKVQEADWVLVFDADEFLSINHPSGHLEGMLDETVAKGANGIVITWRIFGSGHVVDWSRNPVTEQYLYAAPPTWNKGWGVKTLFKFDADYWKLGIHRPKMKNKHLQTGYPDTVQWLNGSGDPMEDYFKFRGWRSIRRTVGYGWAQMNHYAVKGVDAYAIRKFRGNVNNKKDKYNSDYWALQDRNEVKDTAILKHAAKRAKIMSELLKDPVLNRLHFAALDRVEARLEDYKETDAYQALKDGLIEAGKLPIYKVVAKPPKARDPAKIAALMSTVEKTAATKSDAIKRPEIADGWTSDFLASPAELQPEEAVETVENHAIKLPADAALFAPDALDQIIEGKYARRHMRFIVGQLQANDRLLNIGGDLGVVALQALSQLPNLVAMVQNCRDDLSKATAEIASRNGLNDTSRLKITSGPLVFQSDHAEEASGFVAMLNDFRPTVLRLCDRAITPDILRATKSKTLRRIILPLELFHSTGTQSDYSAAIAALGYNLSEDWQDRGMLVFDKIGEIDASK